MYLVERYLSHYNSFCQSVSQMGSNNYCLKFLLDRGPFHGVTGNLCFRLGMTLLPIGFKVRVDSSLPALFFIFTQ